jgi:hypothetical protein
MTSRRAWGIAAFLVALGARVLVVGRFSSPVPYADDWWAVVRDVLAPFSRHLYRWGDLFQSTALGHRLVLTRGWEIFWFVVCGGVDRQVVMVANAVLFAGIVGFLAWVAVGDAESPAGSLPGSAALRAASPGASSPSLSRLPRAAPAAPAPAESESESESTASMGLSAAVVAVWALPLGYANALWGYQSQFYFLIGTALAVGWLGLAAPAKVRGWAVLPAVVGLGAMGSGFVAPALLLAILAWKEWLPWGRSGAAGALGLAPARAAALAAGAVAVAAAGVLALPRSTVVGGFTVGRTLFKLVQAGSWPEGNLIALAAHAPESARYLPHAGAAGAAGTAGSALGALSRALQASPLLVVALMALFALVNWWPWFRHGARLLRQGAPGALGRSDGRDYGSASGTAGASSVTGARSASGDATATPSDWFWLFAGAWTLCQFAAVAVARVEEPFWPTRYVDVTLVGLTANLVLAWRGGVCRAVERRVVSWCLGAAVVVTAVGAVGVELPRKAAEGRAWLKNVRVYMESGDRSRIEGLPVNSLPFIWTEPERFTPYLDDAGARRLVAPILARPDGRSAADAALFRLWWVPWIFAAGAVAAGARLGARRSKQDAEARARAGAPIA